MSESVMTSFDGIPKCSICGKPVGEKGSLRGFETMVVLLTGAWVATQASADEEQLIREGDLVVSMDWREQYAIHPQCLLHITVRHAPPDEYVDMVYNILNTAPPPPNAARIEWCFNILYQEDWSCVIWSEPYEGDDDTGFKYIESLYEQHNIDVDYFLQSLARFQELDHPVHKWKNFDT